MSLAARAALSLALGVAALAFLPIAFTSLCAFGWALLTTPVLGLAAWVLVRRIDPQYSDSPRLTRVAIVVARTAAKLVLFLVITSPFWLVGLGDMQAVRQSQSESRAIAHARAVQDAEQQIRRTSGSYVSLECLADASRCPPGVKLTAPARASLLAPVRLAYRFTFQASQPGDGFAYIGVPVVSPGDCGMQATGRVLVCGDSTGSVCTMPAPAASAVPHATRCPAECHDVSGPKPSPSAR